MLEQLIVKPGEAANLAGRDPGGTLGLPGKPEANEGLEALVEELSQYQARLWAEDRRSLLLILQGLDASGKDGAIRKVFTGVNPQAAAWCRSGCRRRRSSSTTFSGASTPIALPAARSGSSTARTTRMS